MNIPPAPTALAWPPRLAAPKLTITIPTYRRLELLEQAVASALAQETTLPFEVIIVDNGSGDEVREWVSAKMRAEPRLGYYLNQENLGMLGNWNQCVRLARAEHVTMLHDDDLLGPAFLSLFETLALGRANTFSCEVEVGESPCYGWTRDRSCRRFVAADLVLRSLSPFPGVVFRKQDFEALGGFRAELYPVADYDFWLRLLRLQPALKVAACQAFYRASSSQQSFSLVDKLIESSTLLRREAAKDVAVPEWVRERFVRFGLRDMRRSYSRMYQKASTGIMEKIEAKIFTSTWAFLLQAFQKKSAAWSVQTSAVGVQEV
jgi:glycosyltransferase involved in cell wall biosynthesis